MRASIALVAVGVACARPPAEPAPIALPDSGKTYFPADAWRTLPPRGAGVDEHLLSTLSDDMRRGKYGSLHGVVIVRYGFVVFEQYIGWTRDQPHTMQSVTKSVTSLLFGIANKQQPVALALDRPVLDVFTRYSSIANIDDNKRALTLRNLLTMRTSMDFYEQPYPGSPLDQLNRSSDDWVKFILDRRMLAPPGGEWAYNSGAAILTCGVVREVTNESVDAFAARELFEPIGIRSATWFKSPFDGLPHCGGGLGLRAVDLARIGYLVLRRGQWGDTQIVPSEWVDASTRVDSHGPSLIFSSFSSSYGYFWWLFPHQRNGPDAEVITASGSGGQWLFVVPSLDLVVAVIAADGDGLDLFYDGVLPAITN
ncbi:MAG TPA: serine hydrolase [Gemmatimonadaceae bacterium]|nr:serine hydrolase [Gemmatimonadaceae bacterium]